ncbi:MAG: hypothetical protein C0622_07440 [Desulfuromonas sp.]|nr:MAG: hypothetical protein C0622_07440 [Desulfuromonas sp.]
MRGGHENKLDLIQVYSRLLYNVISKVEASGFFSADIYLQSLPYFFSFLCSKGVSPEDISVDDTFGFIEDRYLRGNKDTTIMIYLRSIDECYFIYANEGLPVPEGETIEAFVTSTLDSLEAGGVVRGSNPNFGYEIKISQQMPIEEMADIHKKFHPRS